jgi:transcriptional regulator with XRE-family HTH domain
MENSVAELPKQGLGVVLRTSREARGMSRRDLAEASGLSYPYVSELETGAKYPSDRALLNLAAALDMDHRDLEMRARESESEAAVETVVDSFQSAVAVAADRTREDVLVAQLLAQLEPVIRAAIRTAMEGEQ